MMDKLLCACVRERMWKAENEELRRLLMVDGMKDWPETKAETKPAQPTEATTTIAQLRKQILDLQRQLHVERQRPSEAAGDVRVLECLEKACKWMDKHQRVFGLAMPPPWYDEAKTYLE